MDHHTRQDRQSTQYYSGKTLRPHVQNIPAGSCPGIPIAIIPAVLSLCIHKLPRFTSVRIYSRSDLQTTNAACVLATFSLYIIFFSTRRAEVCCGTQCGVCPCRPPHPSSTRTPQCCHPTESHT